MAACTRRTGSTAQETRKVVDALHSMTGYGHIRWSFDLSNSSSQRVHSIAIGAAEDLDNFRSNSQRRSLRKSLGPEVFRSRDVVEAVRAILIDHANELRVGVPFLVNKQMRGEMTAFCSRTCPFRLYLEADLIRWGMLIPSTHANLQHLQIAMFGSQGTCRRSSNERR
jgi:hypothetical protein